MLRSFLYFVSLFLMSGALLFGASSESQEGPPPRQDHLDMHSPSALLKLKRADRILATLVPDPQSYQLILSDIPSMGAEAVPPHVFSDKPTMIIYQGTLAPSRSNEELAFVMAHELGHLNLHHAEKTGEAMEKIYTGPPIGISGTTFSIFKQKLQEREADMFGYNLYTHSGYDKRFFPYTLNLLKINPNIHFGTTHVMRKPLPSLSMKDSHFSMLERFELLTQIAQS